MAVLTRAQRRRASVFRWAVLLVLGAFFLLPLYAMAEFSTRGGKGRTLEPWRAMFHDPDLTAAVSVSLQLAVLTVAVMLVLLLPTMVWVRLRLPRLHGVLESLCLLPLTIPAIVLVVGLSPVYRQVTRVFGDSPRTLTFVYVVLVLPYAYRALDAGLASIDLRVLSEAARGLGAGWPAVLLRVVLPNMWSAVVSASFLAVALVLGEFTIASLLSFSNLQVTINLLGKADAFLSVAVSLAALLFAFVLLLGLSFVGAGRHRRSRARPVEES